jgi:hypothetical protein
MLPLAVRVALTDGVADSEPEEDPEAEPVPDPLAVSEGDAVSVEEAARGKGGSSENVVQGFRFGFWR